VRRTGEAPNPNSKQAHRHQGKSIGVIDGPEIIALFLRPRASAKSGQINSKQQSREDRSRHQAEDAQGTPMTADRA
jgi:hypothetical protein